MNIRVAMPKTFPGRVIGTFVIIAVVALLVVFFAAILVVAAVSIAVYFVRRIFVGRSSGGAVEAMTAPSETRGREVPAKYEVVKEKEPEK